MLFGIDASRAVTNAPTGTENYSRQLIRALLTAQSGFRFRLYTRDVPPGDLFPAARNYDVRTIPFPRLWTHVRLSAEMRSHPPDVLFVPAHVLPPIHPRRSLVTVHDLGYHYFPQAHPAAARRYLDFSTRWNALAASRVIADSVATRDDLVRAYHIDPAKICVVYPALNAEWRNIRVPWEEIERVTADYHTGDNYIISVGTIHPRKNYVRLLEAMTRLPEDLRLVLVGKRGWLDREVYAAVERLNVHERVRFLDYVPPEDLPALYTGARLAVMPSLYEGFGFPVLEAQACGTPVACSNTSSLPEVAGQAAEFFDPRNVEEMVTAIQHVLQDAARRQELAAAGGENVKRFSWERAAEQILTVAREK